MHTELNKARDPFAVCPIGGAKMVWKSLCNQVSKLRNRTVGLFITAAIAYLLGVLTSPTLPPLAAIKASQPLLRNPELSLPRGSQILPDDLITFESVCGDPISPQDVRSTLLERLFDAVTPFQHFPSAHAAPLLRRTRIKGWGDKGMVFERLMREVRPRVVIELGTFLGASAIHIGSLARQLGLETQILCIDDFRGWPGFREKAFQDIRQENGNVMLLYQFMQNVAVMNLTEMILPVPYSTISALMKLCEWGIQADLIEVDASHDFHSVWADINIAYTLLKPGGVMFGHDYYTRAGNRGVKRAVELFAKLKKLRVEPDGQHWILRV